MYVIKRNRNIQISKLLDLFLLTHEFLAVKYQEQLDVKPKLPELAPFSAGRIRKLNLEILVDIPCIDNDGGSQGEN